MANVVESLRDKYESAARLFFSQLSQIKPYLEDPDIQEVMINRPGSVWIESAGKQWDLGRSAGAWSKAKD